MNKTIWVVLIGMMLSGCNEPERISGAEFRSKMRSGQVATMFFAEYLCEQDNRVYMSESKMSLMDEKIWIKRYYYTDKNELDADFYQTLPAQADCSKFLKELSIIKNKSSVRP